MSGEAEASDAARARLISTLNDGSMASFFSDSLLIAESIEQL